MTWQSFVGISADIIGVLGAVFALGAWLQTLWLRKRLRAEEERMNQKIGFVLQQGDAKIALQHKLRRAELTRAEVMGVLGMIPMKNPKDRFALSYVSQPEFLEQINNVLESEGDAVLTIPCTQDELDQFNI